MKQCPFSASFGRGRTCNLDAIYYYEPRAWKSSFNYSELTFTLEKLGQNFEIVNILYHFQIKINYKSASEKCSLKCLFDNCLYSPRNIAVKEFICL